MRLATKLTGALILGIVLVMAAYAYLQIRREVVFYEGDLQRARRLGAWRATIESVWEREGEGRARGLVDLADDGASDIHLRVVSLDPASPAHERSSLTPDQIAELRRGEVLRLVRTDAHGDEWRFTFAGLRVEGGGRAAIELVEPLRHQMTFIRMSRYSILGATVAVVLVCSVIVVGLHFWFVGRPLRLLGDKARRVAAGDFPGPLDLRQRDEIGRLGAEFDAMCERIAEANRRLADETQGRIQALEQLRHTDRLATVGQLAAGVAHELGTPLNVISARAELLIGNSMPREEVAANARIINEQADRITDIVRQLLDYSRRRGARLGLTTLDRLVARTADFLSSAAERARVTIVREPAEHLPARVDQNQMQQALANIILNGIQAMPEGGRLTVRLGSRRMRPPPHVGLPDADYVCITVADEGVGIPAEHLERIFEPFFTTKPVGEGTGLGLAVAHGIVAEHGGWIEVESRPGKGSRFTICVPRAEADEQTRGVA